jgi:hypothetical protein
MNDDEIDAHYRRANERDASAPSEAVRQAILANARALAAARTNYRRRSAAWGALAAAVLAGLVMTPLLRTPPTPPTAQMPAPSPKAVSPPNEAPRLAYVPAAQSPTTTTATNTESMIPTEHANMATEPAAKAGGASAARNNAMMAARSAPAAARAPAPAAMDAPSALRHAAEIGDVAELQRLLARSNDVDARDAAGRTALMLATSNRHLQAVEALLAHGADPNAADVAGVRPLQVAHAADQAAIAAALQRAGAR